MIVKVKKICLSCIPLVTGLFLALALVLSPLGPLLDHLVHDLLMKHTPARYTGTEVVVVGIDDESLKKFKDPLLLWYGHLARVIEGVSVGGASVAALDIIPAASLENIAPELDQQLVTSLLRARSRGTRVIMGFSPDSEEKKPHRKFLLMSSGAGFVNLFPDEDGKIRTQPLQLTDGDGPPLISVALSVATSVSNKDFKPPETISIDYRFSAVPVISFRWVHDRVAAGDLQALQDMFKGRIVYLGAISDILKDNFAVPAGQIAGYGSNAPGVLLHAITTKTLLSGRLLSELKTPVTTSLSLLLGILSGLLFMYMPLRKGVICLSALFVCVCFGVLAGFRASVTLPFSLPFFAMLAPAAVCFSWRAVLDHRKFSSLQRAFKSYVSPHVMKQIIENPSMVTMSGANTVATLMFTDIRGFTTLSETMPPEAVLEGLNLYFTEMTAAVLEVNGYLNRYLGDGILAVFGAPNSLPRNGALAAVTCALLMLKKLEELNAKGTVFPGMPDKVRIGIGIHTGEIIVGNIGCSEKMDYSVIGDSVNLASRIESLTKEHGVQILISETAHERVKDCVESRYIGFVKVKGREQGIGIYEVLSLREGI